MARTTPRVQFGTTVFGGTDIRSAVVTEEFNPLSITIPVAQLELELYSANAAFSIINPTGDYALLQYLTPLDVYQDTPTGAVFIGRFYLDKWYNIDDKLIHLTCVDEMGLLDTLTYRGGIWIGTPITMGALIGSIFTDTGSAYELDPDLENVPITGWIPICSYREALQQIAFAGGAYILCSRQSGFIKIAKITAAGTVTRGIRSGVPNAGQSRIWQKRFRQSQWGLIIPVIDIFDSEQAARTVDLRTQVTGVEISMHDISEGENDRTLFEGILSTGIYEILFTQPMHTLSAVGATIPTSGANYAILDVTGDNVSVTLTGKVYVDSVSTYGVYSEDPNIVKENILTISEGSLINSSNGMEVAQQVYDYYQQRYIQKVKLFSPSATVGRNVLINTLYGRKIRGVVERMITDLSGGYTAQTDVVGTIEPEV